MTVADLELSQPVNGRLEDTLLGWRGASLNEVLWLARETLDDPEWPTVKAWRNKGGKVLGHFQVYFPEELAHRLECYHSKCAGHL